MFLKCIYNVIEVFNIICTVELRLTVAVGTGVMTVNRIDG